jgi:hypothetical protein
MNFEATINQIIEDEYKSIRSDFYGELRFESDAKEDYITPAIIVLPLSIQGIKNNYMFKSLLDSGSTHTLINRQRLPEQVHPRRSNELIINATIIGEYEIQEKVLLKDVALPEFSKSVKIDEMEAFVFDNPSSIYDIILGRDFLKITGIDLSFSTKTIKWLDMSISMKPQNYWSKEDNLDCMILEEADDDYLAEIKPSKYESIDPRKVVKEQNHLNEEQKQDILSILCRYDKLFSGRLGCYPYKKVHLELKENAKPFHAKAYNVPYGHREIFKNELKRLEAIEVLIKCGASEWAAGTFIIPKKDGRVRWVSDFRQLNKQLRRKIYPLPKINDILQKRNGYKFFTKLDLSMQYYAFQLDEESQQLCVISTPFGKYMYKRLPMGVCQSSDIAQEIMESILGDIEEVEIYIDDIGIFSNSWEEHVQTLHKVLNRLQNNGFSINPLKCEWAIKETDWLGYWLTPTGIKPWNKKIQPILNLKEPRNKHELRSFIGMVTHYKDMWKNRAHILAPLTDLTKNVQYEWKDIHQKAFQDIKKVISTEVLLAYPDHNKPFDIHTDASKFQIASEISQNNKPIAYFSRKLNETQKNYTTEEQELLAIVETLKEYRSMLLGAEINIYTDHDNLTYEKFRSQRVLRWRLYIEEFAPKIQHIPGKQNKIADALSRLPIGEDTNQSTMVDLFYNEMFLNDRLQCPINLTVIQQQQNEDREIQELIQQKCPYIFRKDFSGTQLWVANIDNFNNIDEAKIMIPTQLLNPIVHWYHQILMHAGRNKVEATIKIHFVHPQLHNAVMNTITNCEACQFQKRGSNKGYGQLIPREVNMVIWDTVAVDTIGPWTLTINDHEYTFRALTIIDINSNLAEIVRINYPSAPHVAMKFQNTWLARYPRPAKCIHDNGGEFGPEFQQMLHIRGIQSIPTTIKNPQSNAICERMHSTIENMIRTRLHNIHINQAPNDFMDTIIADAIFALRASIHQTMQTTPSIIAFHRDMLLNIPTFINLANIQYLRQQQVNRDAERQNANRNNHQYQINDQVLVTPSTTTHRKLNPKYTGPYTITQVHQNNTVTIQRRNNITETINIRRIKPFHTQQNQQL